MSEIAKLYRSSAVILMSSSEKAEFKCALDAYLQGRDHGFTPTEMEPLRDDLSTLMPLSSEAWDDDELRELMKLLD